VTPAAGAATPAVAVAVASATSATTVTTGGAAATSITVPAGTAGGLVSLIQTATSTPPPAGYTFVGSQTNISAPAASVAAPLVLAFTVDRPTLEAAGLTAATVEVLRDGVPITTECASGSQSATPDPCVADRPDNADGSATITVRSSHASAWNLGRRVFALSGLFQPVDPRPAVNLAKAGSAIPLKFSLGGYQGLNVLAAGYPKSGPMTCAGTDADPIEATVAANQSTLSYDAATDRYTFVWKTDKSWSAAPAGPCRQLVIRFTDGSERRADFRLAK
jgi:hypothetical protein